MQSQPILIDDEVSISNNSQQFLYYHRHCKNKSILCKKLCVDSKKHGQSYHHRSIDIQGFKEKFKELQESSVRQTQHWIRQMDEIESKAIRHIRRKKEQLLQEIQEIRINIMKMTYKQEKTQFYQSIYQKYRNQRFSSLLCREVNWVMNTKPKIHQLKHSEINKQFEKIIKQFQTFKIICKNIKLHNAQAHYQNQKKENIKKRKQTQKIISIKRKQSKQRAEYLVNFQNQQKKYQQQIQKLKTSAQQLGQKVSLLKNEIFQLRKQKQLGQTKLKQIHKHIADTQKQKDVSEQTNAFITKKQDLYIQTQNQRIQIEKAEITNYLPNPNGKKESCHFVIKGQHCVKTKFKMNDKNLILIARNKSSDNDIQTQKFRIT